MKLLLIILTVTAFFQTTILPSDLVLIILVTRSLIVQDKYNFYLAFTFGLLISFLEFTPLGIHSLIYILLLQIVYLISNTRLSTHILVVMPVVFMCLTLNSLINLLIFKQTLNLWPNVAIESVVALLVFLILRFWEERFIPRKDVKLRMSKR